MFRRLGRLAGRGRLDRESREELRDHVERFVAEAMRQGASESDARRRARLELGEVEQTAEELADLRPGAALDAVRRDVHRAVRSLRRAPVFAAVSIALIAVGVSASTTVYTLVERVLLNPLPFPDPDRLVRLYEKSDERGIARTGVARGNLAEWRRQSRSFDGAAVAYTMGRTVRIGTDPLVVLATQATCDFLPLFAVQPMLGRVFTDEECRQAVYSSAAAPIGADPVTVLGYDLWRRRFGADPGVIGTTITIERRPFRIIGVLPRGFAPAEASGDLYLAWDLEGALPRDQRYTVGFARLRPGVAPAAAQAELDGIAARLGEENPVAGRGWSTSVVPLHQAATAGARPVLLALFGAAALLLVIACGNVAVLFFARAVAGSHEAAVRLALGAARWQIVRGALTEALLLALAGGVAGSLIAWGALGLMPRVWPDLPRLQELAPDAGVLGFALLATLAAALIAGALPAWRGARVDPQLACRDGGRTTEGRPARTVRDALVLGEVALTVVLLVSAGLLIRSVGGLRAANSGFDPGDVVVAPIFLDSERYDSGEKSRAYYQQLFDQVAALPGVVAVGGATAVPASPLGPDFERPVWRDGDPPDAQGSRLASVRMVTPGYFGALRIPVVEGRDFQPADGPDAPRVVAVSAGLARTLWPGQSAVGRRLVVDYASAGTYPYEVIAVIGDVRFRGPRSEVAPEIYFPHAQRSYLILNVVVRSRAGAPPIEAALRRTLLALDPLKPPQGIYPLGDLLDATYLRERRAMQLLVAFAATASLLSALGVYGMLAYHVRQRTTELGIRLALGAGPRRLGRSVAAEAGRLVARGAVAGFALALIGGRLMRGLLYGVSPADPATLLAVLAMLTGIAAFAACLPAWRASRVDPATALRRS